MKKNKVEIITLGCSKNLVDSERLMKQFLSNGYQVSHDSDFPDGEIAVINTCGFIGDAKEESIETILKFAQAKTERKIKQLYVMGCLSQRYREELQTEIPEVDRFYGKFDWVDLLQDLGKAWQSSLDLERVVTTPNHYAYLKLSEGCSRRCSYCAIPLITGAHISRPIEEIVEEVKLLVCQGVKEFQLIAQDLTFYGKDLYKAFKLPELIEQISDIPGVEWIRLHYAYPHQFPLDLLRVMRERKNVCKYLDIALQHISDAQLELMHRHVTKEETIALIEKIRQEVPGIHLRTTVMVGHCGETEDDFQQLKEFVTATRFERLGVFPYSQEEGTYSALHYKDDVPYSVKQERAGQIMQIQEQISDDIQSLKVGHVFRVIIDKEEADYYIGRTEFDSPEVDPEVLIAKTHPLSPGHFVEVKITSHTPFELFAQVIG